MTTTQQEIEESLVELFAPTKDNMDAFVRGLTKEDLLDGDVDGFRLGERGGDRRGGALEFIRCLQEFFGTNTAFVKYIRGGCDDATSVFDDIELKIPSLPSTMVILHDIRFSSTSSEKLRGFIQTLRKEHPSVTRIIHVLDITHGNPTNICYSHFGGSALVFFDEMEALGVMGCSVAGDADLIEEMLNTRVGASVIEKIGAGKSPLETNNTRRLEEMGFEAYHHPKKAK